jgi:hypothetical protein
MEKAKSLRQLPFIIIINSFVLFFVISVILFSLYYLLITPFSWFLGWILGFLISLINFLLIILQTNRIENAVKYGLKPNLGSGYLFFRFLLFTLGFIISATLKINNQEIFNIFSVFAGYLSVSLIIYMFGGSVPYRFKKV